jgi:hypothetical protein
LRKGGLTEDKAVEKTIEEAKEKNVKGKKAKDKKAKSKKVKIKKLKNGEDEEKTGFGFDNAKRIGRKYRKGFLAADEEVEEELNTWIREE